MDGLSSSDRNLTQELTALRARVAELEYAERQRQRAEDALARERAFFQRILDTSPNLVFVKDAEGRFLIVNKALADLYGTTPQVLLNRRPGGELTPPRELEAYAQVEQEVLRSRKAVITEETNTRPDGRTYWFHTIKAPLTMPDGSVHILGIAVDITDRKQTEQALRHSEEVYRRLVENVNEVIYRIEFGQTLDERLVRFVSPRIRNLFGYEPEEFIREPYLWEKVIHPDDLARVLEATRRMREARGEGTREYRIRHRSTGEYHWVEDKVLPFFDDAGNVVAVHGVIRDVTERRQLEERLRQAQNLEAVGRLAGGVAHFFNNLLTIITGFNNLILQDLPPGQPAREYAEQVRKAADRAAMLTSQLLSFGRKRMLRPRPLDINAALVEAEKTLRPLLGTSIELIVRRDPNLRMVKVDPVQIEEVLLTLGLNARDAMPQGGTLTLQTRMVVLRENTVPELPAGPCVLLTVADTGPGIDARTRAKLFEPFFTTKDVGTGTGLGLAAVYGVVKQTGGHIDVDSEPGRGTTFRVYFPVAGSLLTRQVEPESEDGQHQAETILVIEDDERVRSLIDKVLRQGGYTVLQAESGRTALEMVRAYEGPIHLAIVDVILPQLTGPEVVSLLVHDRPNLKALYVSAISEPTLQRDGLLVKGMPFLAKPFALGELTRRVRQALQGSDANPSTPEA